MLLSVLFAVLTFIISSLAIQQEADEWNWFSGAPIQKNRKKAASRSRCSKELASIVYQPITPAFEYLKTLEKEFKTISVPLLQQYTQYLQLSSSQRLETLNNQQLGLLFDFIRKYGVTITLWDGFNSFNSFAINPTNGKIISTTVFRPRQSQALASSYLLNEGFGYHPILENPVVNFELFDPNGVLYIIRIAVNVRNAGIFLPLCCN